MSFQGSSSVVVGSYEVIKRPRVAEFVEHPAGQSPVDCGVHGGLKSGKGCYVAPKSLEIIYEAMDLWRVYAVRK